MNNAISVISICIFSITICNCYALSNNYEYKGNLNELIDSSNNFIPFDDGSGRIKNNHEIGLFTGILSSGYSGCKYPLGIYYAYHYSEFGFIEPLASIQWGVSNEINYSYYHLGLVHGFMGDPIKFPVYFTIGAAYSHFTRIIDDGYYFSKKDTAVYNGFFIPTEWGIKKFLVKRKSLFSIGFTMAFNKIHKYVEFGCGGLISVTMLIK